MHLLILSDGKKGHENQSLGLAEAMLHRRPGSYQIANLSEPFTKATEDREPSAIIGAGHGTHPFLLRLSRRYQCPSIVIMKPSLPGFLFTHCLVPEHDLHPNRKPRKNIIATRGALNRIPEDIPSKEKQGLLMLGGPSKHFHWQTGPVLEAIESIVRSRSELQWTLGDSRRTPTEVLPLIREKELPLAVMPHQESTANWLIDRLLVSREAWITPDSTSMLSEALTAGCHLGTLPLSPRHTRLSRAHDRLDQEGWLTPFARTSLTEALPAPPARLHETARCADLLLERLPL